jgi:uncharacterized protein
MEFEWNPAKAESNLEKHGVQFTEAVTIFGDPLEVTIPDPDHSDSEFRFLSLGCSDRGRVLVVADTERKGRIRLISARLAAPREGKVWEGAIQLVTTT